MARFCFKVAGAGGLIALADGLFWRNEPGWTLGLFAAAWIAAVALLVPAVRRHPGALASLAVAAAMALVLVDDPNPLAVLLFGIAIVSAALLPGARFRDAIGWAFGLAVHGLTGVVRPIRDAGRIARLRERRGGHDGVQLVRLLAIPLVGGALFVALFAGANPLIAQALDTIALPVPGEMIGHLLLWTVVLALVWPTLRPGGLRPPLSVGALAPVPGLPVATLVLSLLVFNAIFAVENGLDLLFLWSGAPLPAGVTLADYAHRGAYTLIVTALLAAAFVLVALHPKSDAAHVPAVRRLLVAWIAQNLLLVASSVHRLADYVAAYQLTELRIAAFAWMGLVAAGLVLVCWRLIRGRSAAWLINHSAAAAGVVLVASAAIDYGAAAAAYNVRHASADRKLDLCYLQDLGPDALLPLIELERRATGERLRAELAALRGELIAGIEREQREPHGWTWRNARRLDRARAAAGELPPLPGRRFAACG